MADEEKTEDEDNTIYVVHPVPPELKKKIVRDGHRIVDARFAPKGAKIHNKPKPAAKVETDPAKKVETKTQA